MNSYTINNNNNTLDQVRRGAVHHRLPPFYVLTTLCSTTLLPPQNDPAEAGAQLEEARAAVPYTNLNKVRESLLQAPNDCGHESQDGNCTPR